LSIGAGHLLHILRRNVDVKILLFNNQIYGLTKGQYSPTSERGKRTKSTPMGSIDHPIDPVRFALGAGATFVARTVDVDAKHFQETLKRAAAHKGTALIEIYQNCPIYNDDAFVQLTDKKSRPDHGLYMEHGKPLVFGANQEQGIRLSADFSPEVVSADDQGILVYDETHPLLPEIVCAFRSPLPTPLGVFRAIERPTYETQLHAQLDEAKSKAPHSVQEMLEAGETWTV
ncbi:MAG: 2-oxoacid:ferredoxin oxidoreductase subunit beta, partial [Myxococcales bacterium]|nr:2-oxoacid:ferredoxin oxidoreductase subunit beta [Myxococcales bacterium]